MGQSSSLPPHFAWACQSAGPTDPQIHGRTARVPCSGNPSGQRSFSRSAFLPAHSTLHRVSSSCPSLNGFEKSFSVLFRKSRVSVLQGWSHPMTRAGARFSFLVVRAAGDPTVDLAHHWTGGHVRATCSEASRPLGASGPPAAEWGVGWRGGTFSLLRAAPPPWLGRPSSPSVLGQGSVSVTLWLPVGASSFPPIWEALPSPQRDLNWLCAGGCRHGALAAAAAPAVGGEGGGGVGERGSRLEEGVRSVGRGWSSPLSLCVPQGPCRSFQGGSECRNQWRCRRAWTSTCPAPTPYPWPRDIPRIPLTNPSSTGSGKETTNPMMLWPQTFERNKWKSETQGDSTSSGSPGTTTAP